MRKTIAMVMFALACVCAAGVVASAASPNVPPPWAYGFLTPPGTPTPASASAAPPPPPDGSLKSLPGAEKQYTRLQIGNQYGPADWFPGEHPAMPPIVANGRQAAMIAACSLCHYPNGKGRQENAGVSGLPVSYFIQTMHDFRDGNRANADPRKMNTGRMIGFAKNMTEDEIKASAEYFGAIKWTPWITKVVEAKMVPKMRSANGIFVPLEGAEAGMEPIAGRLVETPLNPEATEILRDPHSGFMAYVPPGTLKKGEALVKNGGGRTIPCGQCHGEDLKGLGPVPGLAGRSPSYMGRQLYDMQNGFRKGEWTTLMKPVVAKMTPEDIVAVTGYIASLKP